MMEPGWWARLRLAAVTALEWVRSHRLVSALSVFAVVTFLLMLPSPEMRSNALAEAWGVGVAGLALWVVQEMYGHRIQRRAWLSPTPLTPDQAKKLAAELRAMSTEQEKQPKGSASMAPKRTTAKRDFDPVAFQRRVDALPDSFWEWFIGVLEKCVQKGDERKTGIGGELVHKDVSATR